MNKKSSIWKRVISWMLVMVLLTQGFMVSAAEEPAIILEEVGVSGGDPDLFNTDAVDPSDADFLTEGDALIINDPESAPENGDLTVTDIQIVPEDISVMDQEVVDDPDGLPEAETETEIESESETETESESETESEIETEVMPEGLAAMSDAQPEVVAEISDENLSLVSEEPIAEEITVLVEENTAVAEEPMVEETPVTVEESMVEETPVTVEEPMVEETPVTVEESIVEEMPITVEEPIVEEIPVTVEEPAAETSAVEEEPMTEAAAAEEPMAEETPAAEETETDLTAEMAEELSLENGLNVMALEEVDEVPLSVAVDVDAELEALADGEGSDTESWKNTNSGKRIIEKAAELNETVLFASFEEEKDITSQIINAGACWPAAGSTITTNVGDKRVAILFFEYKKKNTQTWSKTNFKVGATTGTAKVSIEFSNPGVVQVVSATSYSNVFSFEAIGEGTTTATIHYVYNDSNSSTYGERQEGTYTYTFNVGPKRANAKAGQPYTLTGGASIAALRNGISSTSSSNGQQWYVNQVKSVDGTNLWTAERFDTDTESTLTITPKVIQSDDGTTDYTTYVVRNCVARNFGYIAYMLRYSDNSWTGKDGSASVEKFSSSSYYDEFTVTIDPYDSGIFLMSDSVVAFDGAGADPKLMSAQAWENGTRVASERLEFTSSDPDVVTIDDNGLMTPKRVGTAQVTAKYGSDEVSATVNVKGIYVDKNSVSLSTQPGQNTKKLVTKLIGADGEVDFSEATVTSNKTQVATMDSDGTITAKSPGTATITIAWGSYKVYVTVTVEGSASLTLDQESATMKVGDTVPFKATAIVDGNQQENPAVTWTSADESIAVVSNGEVTAKGLGSTRIRASWEYDGQIYYNEASVKVVRHGLYLSVNNADVEVGGKYNLLAVAYEMGEQVGVGNLNDTIVWTADNGNVTVELYEHGFTGGSVTGVTAGSSVVTASWADANGQTCSASASITVHDNTDYIINIQEKPDLTIQGDSRADADSEQKWAARAVNETSVSANIDITNNGNSAVVTGRMPSSGKWLNVVHEYKIYMDCLGKTASTYEQFVVKVDAKDGLYFDHYEDSRKVGLQDVVQYMVYQNNKKLDNPTVTFTTDDPTVVELEQESAATCTIRRLKPGKATVTGTWNSYAAQLEITSIGDDGVYVDPGKVTLMPGETTAATAEVWYSNQKVSNPAITWSSSDTDVATVDAEGTITGVDAGRAQVYATWDNNGEKYSKAISVFVRKARSVTVTKVWDDSENWDGIRPESVSVQLQNSDGSANGEPVILNEENNWTYTWSGLEYYTSETQNSGDIYNYLVTEVSEPDGYTAAVSGGIESGYTITNTHTPETVDVRVAAAWDDADNQDGKRPATVHMQFLADGEIYGEKTIVESAANWEYTKSVYKYKNQNEVNWTVEAVDVPEGYTAEVSGNMADGYVVTYHYTPEVINITVNAPQWDDENDQDDIRPDSLTVTLYQNGEATDRTVMLTEKEDGTWTNAVFEGVPKYYNAGKEIVYTVKGSLDSSKYSETVTGSAAEGFTLSYHHTPGAIRISVTKKWNDTDNQDGIRPAEVTVELYADGAATNRIVKLNAENNWTAFFDEMPEKKNGQLVVYTVKENTVQGYTAEVSGDTAAGFAVTNTHTPEMVSVAVSAEWDDADNQDGKRPENLTVELYADGTATGRTTVLNEGNNWKTSFDNLAKYKAGKLIAYTVRTAEPAGYATTVSGSAASGYRIVNQHIPGTVSIAVKGVWNDADDQDGLRTENVSVELYADGAATNRIVKLSNDNNWTASFANLEEMKNSKKVTYTVRENAVPTGYVAAVTGDAAAGFTVTNTHTPETVKISVKNVWDDSDNEDGKRTSNVVVELYADNAATGKTVTLNAENGWTAVFTGVAKYRNSGVLVQYTVKETKVPAEYKVTVSGNAENGFTVTNAYTATNKQFTLTLKTTSYTYNGKARKPAVTVYAGSKKLSKSNYTVKYKNNTEAGTATVTVTGKGKYKNYSGTANFKINYKAFKLKLKTTSYTYNGKARKPAVTVYAGSKKLSKSNYTVSYKNNKNPGTATVTVKGKGKYKSYNGTATFTINPKAFKLKLETSTYTYNGKAKKPAVTVYVGSKKLNKKYYTVAYKDNKNAGTATVTVTGKGKYKYYAGTATFKINLKKLAKPSVTSKKTATATVKWKRDKQAEGYQIQYSTKKNFKSATKVTVKKSSQVSTTLKKLKSKQTYYVRIRSYKKVGTKYIYSAWSTAKQIKVK